MKVASTHLDFELVAFADMNRPCIANSHNNNISNNDKNRNISIVPQSQLQSYFALPRSCLMGVRCVA